MHVKGSTQEVCNIKTMAAARSRSLASLPIFRSQKASLIIEKFDRFSRLFILKKRDSSSMASDSTLLQKLLSTPVSRIKAILDDSKDFPLPALLNSLNSSAPNKANLVLEWKLEKLSKDDKRSEQSYLQLIFLCEKVRNLPMALLAFNAMEARGIKPTSSSFNALISTSLSSGNLLKALSLFEIMEASEDYRPDSYTYNAFISAHANLGNIQTAESWLSAKRDHGFADEAQTYDSLIQCSVKSRKFEDAERYYNEMMLAEILPTESIFRNMLIMFCQKRNAGKVKEIFVILLRSGLLVDRNTASKIVALYQQLGLVEEMEELLKTLMESNQNSDTLSLFHNSIVRMYSDRDRLDDVEHSVGRMLKQGISFSCVEIVEKAIECYFRGEAYDKLDMFLSCIKHSHKLTSSTYDLLCTGYQQAGLVEKLNAVVNDREVAGFV